MADKHRRLTRLQGSNRGPTNRFSPRQQLMRKGLLAKVEGRQLPPQEQALYERYQEEDRRARKEWLQSISPECRQHLEECQEWGLALIMGEDLEGQPPEGFMNEPGPGRPPGPGWPKWARP